MHIHVHGTAGSCACSLQHHRCLKQLCAAQPTTLAAQEGSQSYDTALALTPTGTDSLYPRAAGDVFFRDPAVIYENITIDVTLAAGANVNDAPNGTFAVTAAGSTANIIWDDTVEPVRTCVVCPCALIWISAFCIACALAA